MKRLRGPWLAEIALALALALPLALLGRSVRPAVASDRPSLSRSNCTVQASEDIKPGCVLPVRSPGQPIDLYVSPSGRDANPGTRAAPFRTLVHAQRTVRAINGTMTADITVHLESGTYRPRKPLAFGPKDSGANGYKVVWTSAPGARPVISGARRISGWKLSDPSRNMWSAAVPAGLKTRQIYVNGMRASLASGSAPTTLRLTPYGYKASSLVMAAWRNLTGVEFGYVAQWGKMSEQLCPIEAIKRYKIFMAEPCWDNSTKRVWDWNLVGCCTLSTPDFVENAYELLDRPGEFYLDTAANRLYYIPRHGENMHAADVEVPVLQHLIDASGTPDHPIHNLTFSNLQFSFATWLQPSTAEGFSEMQANYTITGPNGYATEGLCRNAPHGTCPYGAWTKEPGNIQLSYDRNIDFMNDRFVHLGAAALNLDNGSQDDVVEGSVFTDISGNGIEIGNVNRPAATGSYQTTAITVADNHLYDLPVEYYGGVAVLVGYASDSLITHNQIDHTSYTAISMGWGGWLDKHDLPPVANSSHDNVVSDNLIFSFMQVLSDGGGVYTQGATGTSLADGEHVTGNVIYDQLDFGRAIQSDNGATFVTYAGNVLYNDTYDWGSPRIDYTKDDASYNPQVVRDNYWQQGDPDSFEKQLERSGNTIITGPEQAPASILANAGIEARSRDVLSWRAEGETVPTPPQLVKSLYGFDGKAYLTWHPSFGQRTSPVTSYTVTPCHLIQQSDPLTCTQAGIRPTKVASSTFARLGYAVVSGLTDGQRYSFTVTGNSGRGSSAPSVPSAPVPVDQAGKPDLPGGPQRLAVRTGRNVASLIWYAPAEATAAPILAYVVTDSSGRRYTFTGLSEVLESNRGSRILRVFGGLVPGRSYRFSVAAVTPAGVGPATRFPAFRTG